MKSKLLLTFAFLLLTSFVFAETENQRALKELKKLVENSQWSQWVHKDHPKGEPAGILIFSRGTTVRSLGGGFCNFYSLESPNVLKLYNGDPSKNRKLPFRALRIDLAAKTAVTDRTLSTTGDDTYLRYDGPAKR